jgi:hypothetical protein
MKLQASCFDRREPEKSAAWQWSASNNLLDIILQASPSCCCCCCCCCLCHDQALNIASASGIVFANKLVMTTYGFGFTCTLTWIHTLFTLVATAAGKAASLFCLKLKAAAAVVQDDLAGLAAARSSVSLAVAAQQHTGWFQCLANVLLMSSSPATGAPAAA